MRIVPDSTISLYSGVEIDNGEQLVFSSKANQESYFENKLVESEVRCTMVKKTGALRVTISGSIVSTCNYISFVNPSFDNKTVYGRIIDYNYVNNECVEITYVIDYWQTWMFDLQFQDSYIEREHLSQSDYALAEANPYNPNILEFKTNEDLPISTDIEKPYYSLGDDNTYDGVYCGDAVCNDYSLPNRCGLLLVFSDLGLTNIDGTAGAIVDSPSYKLKNLMTSLVYSDVTSSSSARLNNLCWYKLSTATYNYFADNGYVIQSQFGRGQLWSNTSLGDLYPCSSNRLQAPVNYVYIDEMANSSENPTSYNTFSELLSWFTDNSVLGNIIDIYPVPTGLMMYSATNYSVPIQVQMPTAASQNVVNKKLDLFPYSYYRVIAPNGDVKELRIEDFKSAQDGGQYCNIGLSLDILEKPNLIVAPKNYKASGASPHNLTTNLNVREGLIFSQFPTMPYSIDAYQMAIAAKANSIIGNNTVDYQYDFNQKQGGFFTQLKGGLATLASESLQNMGKRFADATGDSTISNALVAAGSFIGNAAGIQATSDAAGYQKLQNEMNMSNEAYNVLVGKEDTAVHNNFEYTKPAYGANEYHQINGDGIVNYNDNSFVDVLLLRVSINPTILAQYDRYFTNYGYKSGRCGIPRVVNYTTGVTDSASLPQWMLINNKYTTYIKTRDCKIIASMAPVAQFVKAMFDTGVRMIKGD